MCAEGVYGGYASSIRAAYSTHVVSAQQTNLFTCES